jgi:hypothetical protein
VDAKLAEEALQAELDSLGSELRARLASAEAATEALRKRSADKDDVAALQALVQVGGLRERGLGKVVCGWMVA